MNIKKVLITGATSGFGKLMVKEFLDKGFIVFASGRKINQRKELFKEYLNHSHDRLFFIDLDVTIKEEVILARKTIEAFGEIDILVNNAGHGLFGPLEGLEDHEIRQQMEVNFFGVIELTRQFLPQLRSTKGMILNLSSVFGFMGFPLTSMYAASKFAVEGLTESLRWELHHLGIRVCLIEPGGFSTSFGDRIIWSNHCDSYSKQFNNYQDLRLKIASRKPQDPTIVARAVVKLALKKNPPMRVVLGHDGKLSWILRRLLPSRIYFYFFDKLFSNLF